MDSKELSPALGRRPFLLGLAVAVLGGVAALVPLTSGVLVFLNPLRRSSTRGVFVRVAHLSAVPDDGTPRKFPVVADRVNAWNRTPSQPIGSIYLRRLESGQVQAFNVLCPHAGCPVQYQPVRRGFLCPCHTSRFALHGAVEDPRSPSPRGLDELEVEVKDSGHIWVRFQNFLPGTVDKRPVT